MNHHLLFTDGSYNAQQNLGYGAYLFLSTLEGNTDSLHKRVRLKKFDHTSSSMLELQTVLWALSEIQNTHKKIIIYSDSQNVINLPKRRKRLVQNEFRSKKNKLLKNHLLYREFYRFEDLLDLNLLKVTGHLKGDMKDHIDKLFSLVDKASRKALRMDLLK